MRALRALAIIALSVSLAGCWLMKPDRTPQEEFAEALMRGNSMQASQVWLKMSPEDRLKFSRGEGIAPDPNAKEEVKREILNRYQNQLGGGPVGAGGIEEQIPTPLGASIHELPAAADAAAPPPPPTAPNR